MGRYLTDVHHTEFLAAPVPGRGKPGLFDVRVPEASLPEGARAQAQQPPSDEGVVVFDKEY